MNMREMLLSRHLLGSGGSGGSGGGVVNICESTNPTKEIVSDFSQVGGIRFPNAESIGQSAFHSCTALTSIDLPAATSIGDGAFANCTALTSIGLPVAMSISNGAFAYCTALTSIDLPVAMSISNGAFAHCTALTSIDLPVAMSIGDGAFTHCTNLSTVILRNPETVCQIIVSAVLGTKIVTAEGAPTGEGFIYVPAALFEGYVELIAYQAAMMLVSQGMGEAEAQATAEYIARAVLRKIEDYPEICGS